VFEKYAEFIEIGSVLELRNISVFRPTKYSRYLNILMESIIRIVTKEELKDFSSAIDTKKYTSSPAAKSESLLKRSSDQIPIPTKKFKPIAADLTLNNSEKYQSVQMPLAVSGPLQVNDDLILEMLQGIDDDFFTDDIY
jgi:hypothetical protein